MLAEHSQVRLFGAKCLLLRILRTNCYCRLKNLVKFNVLDVTEFLPDGHIIKYIHRSKLNIVDSKQFLMCGVNHKFATHTPGPTVQSMCAASQR